MLRERRLYRARAAEALRALALLDVNDAPPTGPAPSWNAGWSLDELRCTVAREPPGAPVPGGAWEIACRLVHDYQFAEPRILRALYRRGDALPGRDMLLEGRFLGLRFDMGVRVTSLVDGTQGSGAAARRVWGWGYQTLEGHLEEGELTYLVVKHLGSGEVEFRITGRSRRAPIANPLVRLGFVMFGRSTQHRFLRAAAQRLCRLVHAELHGAPAARVETVPGDPGVAVAPARHLLTPAPHLSSRWRRGRSSRGSRA
ncbi:hypothetical protein GCM10018793_49040 [Streptomyces sulfonofaciens]|uniref:DUF1990 domain-containing protein n=1 Tax=Streptomyces sulfonofaciens TaxID=68272 RepID=A0A919L6H5_9ACTN|nr:DUF1990 family protein [Streptomyces sulfonofaciens]GHH84506.1 hypothetical protein GCM10018793_49040 [Streptomyces sulfonofaciens]